ncbi:unnamed protein product [Urochloa humidicola]
MPLWPGTPPVKQFPSPPTVAFFQQRYVVGQSGGWSSPGGLIFYCCGNEDDIAWFAANSGLVWERHIAGLSGTVAAAPGRSSKPSTHPCWRQACGGGRRMN